MVVCKEERKCGTCPLEYCRWIQLHFSRVQQALSHTVNLGILKRPKKTDKIVKKENKTKTIKRAIPDITTLSLPLSLSLSPLSLFSRTDTDTDTHAHTHYIWLKKQTLSNKAFEIFSQLQQGVCCSQFLLILLFRYYLLPVPVNKLFINCLSTWVHDLLEFVE